MAAARRVAANFVAARWPELVGAAPTVAVRLPAPPSAELLARLGLDGAEVGPGPGMAQYTFVFSGACTTADGADGSMVVAVTVDDHLRIVKTSVTR